MEAKGRPLMEGKDIKTPGNSSIFVLLIFFFRFRLSMEYDFFFILFFLSFFLSFFLFLNV